MNTKIKSILLVLFASVMLTACGGSKDDDLISTDLVSNSQEIDGTKGTKHAEISFDKTEHDFGEVLQGEIVSYTFKFKNTGNSDLLISSHTASCGCTVPNYPKKAIAPGEEGKVTVEFNSAGKKGVQHKTITLATNCEPSAVMLHIKVLVKEV